MKQRTASSLAWSLWAVFPLLVGGGLALQVLQQGLAELFRELPFVLVFLAFATVGALIASRQPRNLVGWMFEGVGVVAAIGASAAEYVAYRPPDDLLPGAVWLNWIASWAWTLAIGTIVLLIPLVFPNGRLPSRRWRPFAAVTVSFLALGILSFALDPASSELGDLPNPVGVPALRGAADLFESGGLLVLLALSLGSVASLVVRYRGSDRDHRQRIKWFVFGVAVLMVWFLVSGLAEAFGYIIPSGPGDIVGAVTFASVPVGAGIGILRYRLFDIDVVINRTLVFGLLAGLVTAMYLGIVVGIGSAIGSRANLFLSVLATAMIALLFQPLRARARHFANRLVYGKRATPYEVLSEFGERLAGSYASEDVLPRLVRVAGQGVGAASATVWLRVGDVLRPEAMWPDAAGARGPVPTEAGVTAIDEDAQFEVRHQGELLGAISVAMPPREALTPTGQKLLQDLAAQAGLILRNVRLIEELRASRQRIVAAQDQERRRLERNIHDGAQQQLVALAVKLRLVETLAEKDPARTAQMASQAKAELQEALDDLRDLARGIYPPLLADKGLPAAVESQARKATLTVTVESDGIGRYPQEVEAGVYFCVLEALQNVAKYAEASRVTVRLDRDDGHLVFDVIDDGRGFDPATTPSGSGLQNMADRVEALGGSLSVESQPGRGTRVIGRVPVDTSS